MKVTAPEESVIRNIGHAFGYCDCGEERGLFDAFPSREAVRRSSAGASKRHVVYDERKAGRLYRVSPSGRKSGSARGALLRQDDAWGDAPARPDPFCEGHGEGRRGPQSKNGSKKEPYLFVGLVCVREPKKSGAAERKKRLTTEGKCDEVCRDADGNVGAVFGVVSKTADGRVRIRQGGRTNFVRKYTLASGGSYCDCGYHKK